MSIITINGTAIPDPSEMTVGIFDLSSSKTGRTQGGRMVKDIIARKSKLSIKYPTITWQNASIILNAIEQDVYLNVRYPDPKTGNYITKVMYVGDRTAPAVRVVDDEVLWGGISFELIER